MTDDEYVRRSRVAACTCGATVLGYVEGDPCPSCDEVILGAAE